MNYNSKTYKKSIVVYVDCILQIQFQAPNVPSLSVTKNLANAKILQDAEVLHDVEIRAVGKFNFL